jgi:diguanylate cyclase (GGDEF)-like protein
MTNSILIVDDDDAIRESAEDFLEIKDYVVESAASAEEAIERLNTFKADIVVTDIMMGGMDGLELTRYINDKFDSKVIVMTGFNADYSYKDAIDTGASDFIFKPFRFEELDLRIKRVLHEMALKKEYDKTMDKIKKLVITDDLTGLHNSRHFASCIETEIERYHRYSHPLSLLMMDIDFFKAFNDTWGHVEGDTVLNKFGKVINSCIRNTDTGFRYGGEEFAVILPETRLEKACCVGTRIKDSISSVVFNPESDKTTSITISIGATELIEKDDRESFIKRGDKALYLSKNTGRNKLSYLVSPD